MIKEAVAQGSTVEEAFARACAELGVDTAEATCEVLELPTKKTFGIFGGKPAKVKATLELPDPVEEKPKTEPAKKPEKPKKVEKTEKTERSTPAPVVHTPVPAAPVSAPADGVDPAGEAAAYLKRVLGAMGLTDVDVEITREENSAALSITGGDVSFIIGHRGETLDALQYLSSLVANHVGEAYYRVTLDVGNYREKRKTTLEGLGRRMAIRAVKSGRNSSLEPMNPYERRIIHTAVQSIEGATSWSEGEAQGRHVVIGPEGGERRRNDRGGRGGYGRGRNGGSRPRSDGRSSQSSQVPASSGAAPRADDPAAPIYGKIEVKK